MCLFFFYTTIDLSMQHWGNRFCVTSTKLWFVIMRPNPLDTHFPQWYNLVTFRTCNPGINVIVIMRNLSNTPFVYRELTLKWLRVRK